MEGRQLIQVIALATGLRAEEIGELLSQGGGAVDIDSVSLEQLRDRLALIAQDILVSRKAAS